MNDVLALFAKAPIPGHAKTRLGRQIGMQRAADLYRSLLSRQLRRAERALPRWRHIVYAADARGRSWFEQHAGGWELRQQAAGDLGQRMHGAFTDAFAAGAERMIIIGADIPDLAPAHLAQAEAALAGHDLVLGPCPDGGYYLIGQRAPGAPLFDGIPWSSAQVLPCTLARAGRIELSTHLLAELPDIDTLEDWRRYLGRDGHA